MSDTNQQELLQSLQQVMHDFKEGGRLRDKEGRRIARRTAQIVRWSSVGMVLLGSGLLLLLLVLTKDLVLITNNIVIMSDNTKTMSQDLHTMVGTMNKITDDMGEMKQTIATISVETGLMRENIGQMKNAIVILPAMNGNVEKMSQDFKVLNHQMARMVQLMSAMEQDTNNLSKPMRMMPWN
jgi:hypothetical protein